MNTIDFQTKLELLTYPDPQELHPVEAAWREFCRELITRKHLQVSTLDNYVEFTNTSAVYPKDVELEYIALKLVGESGEIAQVVGKWLRGDFDSLELRSRIISELGDVLWYIARFCKRFNVSFEELARLNKEKLTLRMKEGVIKGTGESVESRKVTPYVVPSTTDGYKQITATAGGHNVSTATCKGDR